MRPVSRYLYMTISDPNCRQPLFIEGNTASSRVQVTAPRHVGTVRLEAVGRDRLLELARHRGRGEQDEGPREDNRVEADEPRAQRARKGRGGWRGAWP
jgi:hypothetical protein